MKVNKIIPSIKIIEELKSIKNLEIPFYKKVKTEDMIEIYKIVWLPTEELHSATKDFYDDLGNNVGKTCFNGLLFLYDSNGELEQTIDWIHKQF